MGQSVLGLQGGLHAENIWFPFQSKHDWEFAQWSKNRGPGSTAVTELLAIDGVVDNLGLSFRNAQELNRLIDQEMPGCPKFECEEIHIGGESYDFYFRGILPCIRTLFGDPSFTRRLVFAPECHYQDPAHTTQLFGEMHTGKWWWSVQQSLESHRPGATVIPIILSSDKTQLTHFQSKSAYPVYMSIGNIPKDIRSKPTQRAQMLLGYIPTTWLEHIKNKAGQRRALANLFHACMHKILSGIEHYGETGIAMATGDGVWYRCHPILATFVGDYPEQSLVACTPYGRCPKCSVPRDEHRNYQNFPIHNIRTAIDTFSLCDDNPTTFHAVCREANLKPTYRPFWEHFPFTNIFLSITPDILHQLQQGIFKYLIRWLIKLWSEEIDAHCSRLPPNHNARHFYKGITMLSNLTGQEHKDISCIILGLVVDLPLLENQSTACLIRAVRALLDFFYLSQYSVHSTESLDALEDALCRFHEDKDIFIELRIRQHFNLPKLHSLSHYRRSIMLFGAADNYNTEQSERLHIDFTKNTYQATNFKEELKQMVTWLERYEAMRQRAVFMELHEGNSTLPRQPPVHYPFEQLKLHPFLTMHPSERQIPFASLTSQYGAIDFQDALADFIVQHNYPELSANAARRQAGNTLLPFQRGDKKTVDVIHVRPEARNSCGTVNPSRFDTALVKNGSRIAVVQIRLVFQLSTSAASSVFLPSRPTPPSHFAYVEWFSAPSAPDPCHGMSRVSRSYGSHGRRTATIIRLTDICRSVQLFPVFGPVAPRQWQGATVLEECQNFYINPFVDKHMYQDFRVIKEIF
ncbi:hypothetical protein V8E53_008025 [Lactarius tabidus]